MIAVGYSMGGPSRSCCGAATATSCRARALRDDRGLHAQPPRATVVPGGDAQRGTAARVATLTRAVPSLPAWGVRPSRLPDVGRRRDAPPRLAHDRRGRPLDQHVQRQPLDRSGRRSDRDRVHDRDHAVRPDLQLAIADAIPGATVHRIDDGHLACAQAGLRARARAAPASTSPTASRARRAAV